MNQSNNTKKLKRLDTDILHIHPIKKFPPSFFNIPPDSKLKTTNSFYAGIYAYSIEDSIDNPEDIITELVSNKFEIPFYNLPDFIAVHGKFFISKSQLWENDIKKGWRYTNFPKEANGFSWLDTKELTSGFFYFDLITQFANMDLSAAYQMDILPRVTEKLIADLKNNGKLFQGLDYKRPKK